MKLNDGNWNQIEMYKKFFKFPEIFQLTFID